MTQFIRALISFASIAQGNNKAEMDKVRTGQQGLLWPDVVGSSRLFLMPPAVIALLVIFSRYVTTCFPRASLLAHEALS